MTLTVTAYHATEDADGERLEEIACPSDLAGFESTRRTFYAGPTARRLGLTLLPQLAASDLWARGDELTALRAEVVAMLNNLPTDGDPYWPFRLNNILQAIEAASAFGPEGLVVIG